jgi:thiamine pyrophosphate-dependent acetolactate synthase large subunit-like protein
LSEQASKRPAPTSAPSPTATGIAKFDRPVPSGVNAAAFGSDAAADALRATGVDYIALNPGASYRGFHDSLVNYLGNAQPQMLLCLHEESAVAIAHGYAKVTGRAMAAMVHSNVGLMHATMAIFNAWCDRMPMLILGATGPVDAAKRRPWIDWIHTASDQGALVRGFTKWDDQPASPSAAREAILRAAWIANTAPCGPTYVNLDAGMQEAKLAEPLPPISDAQRLMPAVASAPDPVAVAEAARLLREAKQVVILAGRVSRALEAWNARVALAERLGARVITDIKVAAAFPTDHPLHLGTPSFLGPTPDALAALRDADVIVSLDWVDLASTLKQAGESKAKIVQISVDHHLHNGWSMDYQGLPPVDLFIASTPDQTVPALIEALGAGKPRPVPAAPSAPFAPEGDKLTVDRMADTLRRAVGTRPCALTHVSLSWNGASWPLRHPLDYLGSDGGAGIGGGPGLSVGAALALQGTGRLPVAVCGDGDFLMGVTALWTAAHYNIPLLIVIANNRSFFNDELHQERVARMRGRPVENRWVGQRISDPDIDLAAMARAQGAQGFGPVKSVDELAPTFEKAIAAVEAGAVVVVDVWVEPGYSAAMTATMVPKGR